MLLVLGLVVTALTWADMGETATTAQRSFAQQIRLYPALLGAGRFWAYCGVATFASGCFYAFLGGAPYVGAKVFGLQPSAIGLAFALPAMMFARPRCVTRFARLSTCTSCGATRATRTG